MSAGPLVVVGDALLDRDIEGHAGRLCPDTPAPVVDREQDRARPGGAALAALLASTCPDSGGVVLAAPLGEDPASQTVRDLLPPGLTVIGLPLDGALQEKTRIIASGHTLLRLDTPASAPGTGTGPASAALERAVAAIEDAAAVLVSDYGHGTAALPEIREALAARARHAPVVWDPHPRGAPPVPGAALVTPNEAEAATAAGLRPGGLREATDAAGMLLERWRARAIAVTLGARGALLARPGLAPLAVPALPADPGDACGAGDMFAAAAAAALRDGALLSEAVPRAVAAAGRFLAAGGVGALDDPADGESPEAPGDRRPPLPRQGDGTLVATGGCFDVLHAGHVSMLRAARSLGDRLVVCLNSDASVRRLKGAGRPLNPAADRVSVLRALDCVDEVLVFSEDTPERILGELRPDIWVKGGDYDGRELAEAAVLRRWGGLVVTVPYLEGRSTTRIASAAARSSGQSRREGTRPAAPRAR